MPRSGRPAWPREVSRGLLRGERAAAERVGPCSGSSRASSSWHPARARRPSARTCCSSSSSAPLPRAALHLSRFRQSAAPRCQFPSVFLTHTAPSCNSDLRPEVAYMGEKFMHTPNIDKLAAESLVFQRAFCQQAVSKTTFSVRHPVLTVLTVAGDRSAGRPGTVSFPAAGRSAPRSGTSSTISGRQASGLTGSLSPSTSKNTATPPCQRGKPSTRAPRE